MLGFMHKAAPAGSIAGARDPAPAARFGQCYRRSRSCAIKFPRPRHGRFLNAVQSATASFCTTSHWVIISPRVMRVCSREAKTIDVSESQGECLCISDARKTPCRCVSLASDYSQRRTRLLAIATWIVGLGLRARPASATPVGYASSSGCTCTHHQPRGGRNQLATLRPKCVTRCEYLERCHLCQVGHARRMFGNVSAGGEHS